MLLQMYILLLRTCAACCRPDKLVPVIQSSQLPAMTGMNFLAQMLVFDPNWTGLIVVSEFPIIILISTVLINHDSSSILTHVPQSKKSRATINNQLTYRTDKTWHTRREGPRAAPALPLPRAAGTS